MAGACRLAGMDAIMVFKVTDAAYIEDFVRDDPYGVPVRKRASVLGYTAKHKTVCL